MPDLEHLRIVNQSISSWNKWRLDNPSIKPDLSEAQLDRIDISGGNFCDAYMFEASLYMASAFNTNFANADLRGVDLRGAKLVDCNFSNATLDDVNMYWSNMSGSNFNKSSLLRANCIKTDFSDCTMIKSNLRGANLFGTIARRTDFTQANLSETNMTYANFTNASLVNSLLIRSVLVNTILSGANISGSHVYGISAWDVDLESSVQQDLVISRNDDPPIYIDDLQVAQFVYILMNNRNLRSAIDTIGSKGVLILGRFSGGRIDILLRLKDELRRRRFFPLVFDFERPSNKDLTETIRLLASLSSFVIVDITNPRSTPLELQAIVPDYMIPFITIIQSGEEPFAMFKDLWQKYQRWVFEPISYNNINEIIAGLDIIIARAQLRAAELAQAKAENLRLTRMQDLLQASGSR